LVVALVSSRNISTLKSWTGLVNLFTACWTITTAIAVLNQDAWQVGSARQLRVCDARHPLCGGGASVPARTMLSLQFYPPFAYSNLPPTLTQRRRSSGLPGPQRKIPASTRHDLTLHCPSARIRAHCCLTVAFRLPLSFSS
jgi:hypothetical protein